MPRVKPTTEYTPRVKPTTEYTTPRDWGTPFTCDTTSFTCDTTSFTCDKVSTGGISINTSYTRPRYSYYVEDITWANVFDLSWELVQWISGNPVNKIDTVYT